MKISLNSLKTFTKADLSTDKLIDKIGAQLGAVDEFINFGEKYQHVVIVKVVSCQKHPNADKLALCKIDDGGVVKNINREDDGTVQVVCGAPNVREGLIVAWLPPGATVPDTFGKDPFVLEARELRGSVSNGMIASPKELALGDSHEGILEIDGDHKPGTDFAAAFGLKDDVVIDIENKMFTHRPDCFGFLGLAREIAGIQGLPFKSPDWYITNPEFPAVEAEELPLTVKNEVPKLAQRFTAITMRDVKVGPSPVWLQVELAKVGQKSINNIVDYTNYFMLVTGQPLHAYDYDKVKSLSSGETKLVIRQPKKGEKVKLLDGKVIEPRAEAIMIATDKQLIGIGGVMGGADTGVGLETTNLIIECANFDMYSVRRTSMAHGLFTDAVTRFNKGQSPLQNLAVSAKIVDEIRKYAGGKVASELIDDNHTDGKLAKVKVSAGFINSRLGVKLSDSEISKLLENVEFKVEAKGENLEITAPFWRTDIEIPEDIVEEVGRLYGYDHLPLELPKNVIVPTAKDPLLVAKAEIRQRLAQAGANEVLTYSFVHGNLLQKTGQDSKKAYQIANALSPDLQYYRMSLIPSLLDKIHGNIKAGYDEFALFELGKSHGMENGEDKEGLPREFELAALVVTAKDKLKKTGAAYYQACKYLEELVGDGALEFKPVSAAMKDYQVVQPYDLNRTALVSIKDGEFLGIIGEFKPSVTASLKLPKYTAGFEVDITVLQPLLAAGPSYLPLLRFPKVEQDITLKVQAKLSHQELYEFVDKELGANAPDNTHIRLETVDIYQKEDDTANKQVSFRVTITGTNRTLTDKEVNGVLEAIAVAAKTKLKAERI